MRLYLNKKESNLIKVILNVTKADLTENQQQIVDRVLDRMSLCEKLQHSEDRSKYEGGFVYVPNESNK